MEAMEEIEELATARVSRRRRVIIPRKHYGDQSYDSHIQL
jgi:hypothetical protein